MCMCEYCDGKQRSLRRAARIVHLTVWSDDEEKSWDARYLTLYCSAMLRREESDTLAGAGVRARV